MMVSTCDKNIHKHCNAALFCSTNMKRYTVIPKAYKCHDSVNQGHNVQDKKKQLRGGGGGVLQEK